MCQFTTDSCVFAMPVPTYPHGSLVDYSKFVRRSVEITAYAGSSRRYQGRADVDLVPPTQVYPFAINEITNSLSRPPLRWRGRTFEFVLVTMLPICDLEMARTVLVQWAEERINEIESKTAQNPARAA